jgi:hypothetical protein
MLPAVLQEPLARHLAAVRAQHARDVAAGGGFVTLPDALRRKLGAEAWRGWPASRRG